MGTPFYMGMHRDRSGRCDPAGADPAGRLLVVRIWRGLDRPGDLVYPLLLGGLYENLCLEAAALSLTADRTLWQVISPAVCAYSVQSVQEGA